MSELLRQKLSQFFSIPASRYFVIDSFPLPVCKFGRARYYRFFRTDGTNYGRCPSKKETYFGFKVHALITVITNWYRRDQGRQYTSKAFIEFCESVHVFQSMSRAGYPYDNAPMERYFNTLKNESTNLYEFRTQEELYQTVEEFAYATYNHVRPHLYNGYRTPFEARCA